MAKRLAPLVALLFAAAACTPTAAPTPAPAKPQSYDVQVDSKASAFNLATTAYFPNELKVHAGDTIRFSSVDRGEPHTVAFGTMVDAALAALAKLPPPAPNAPPPPEPAELQALPELIGQPPKLEVSQSAGQPCFLETGKPAVNPACTKDQQKQPDFSGTQAFYNSGYLADKAVFTVKLADGIKPGVYGFICLLHRAEMTGKITVVDKSAATQTPDDVKAAGAARLSKIVAGLQASVDGASKAPADKALAGVASPSVPEAFATVFGPKEVSIKAGGTVAWTVFGPHTISFNAPQDAVGVFNKAADGSLVLNGKSLGPQNSAGAAPPPPGPPPPAPIVIEGGTWDGKGFRSSGLILSFPPVLYVYKTTFTQPGTYPFKCTIHPDMEGTVKVGN